MVSALVPRSSDEGLFLGWGNIVVFLDMIVYSRNASLYPRPGCSKAG